MENKKLVFNFKYLRKDGFTSDFFGEATDDDEVRKAVLNFCKRNDITVGSCKIEREGKLYDCFSVCW